MDKFRRGVNHSSFFLPLDATLRTKEPASTGREGDTPDGGSDSAGEDTVTEEQKSEEKGDEDVEEDTFMSIGVDFGTTYSGVAWSLSTSPKDVFIVSDWETDEANNHDLEKVPSIVTYNSHGKVNSWGFTLEERRHHISWFKMGLCEEATEMLARERPERYEKLHDLLKKYKKKPLDVTADYLRLLWAHAMGNIQESVDPVLWENIKMKIVLTVPAIWDHKAQDLTRQAAKMAGMLDRKGSTLELIAEPEAAALAVFMGMNTSRTQSSLKVGESFVICDAGGGTVDLMSYRIEQLNPLTLVMCAEATGGCCGAIFLDGAFENQIRTIISENEYSKLRSHSVRKMMNDWEFGLKRTFKMNVAEDQTWHVHIPGFQGMLPKELDQNRALSALSELSTFSSTLSLRSYPDTLTLKPGHVKAIFSEVCSKIVDLIKEQLAVVENRDGRKPAYILPVGGLGGNRYLKEQLSMSFKDVQLRKPSRPWSAICRGAVLRGLGNDLVVNHVAKYNYGLSCNEPFIEVKHSQEDRAFLELPRIWVARNQMEWFLKKGKDVAKDTPVCHDYFFAVTEPSHLRSLSAQIYYSESVQAETRITPSVKSLCTLEMKFPTSIFEDLPKRTNDKGVEWRKLQYMLEMQVSSGQLNWTVKHQGIERGKITTGVEYERAGVTRNERQDVR